VVDSVDRPSITIAELDGGDPLAVADFYQQVLLPHFSADELENSADFAAGVKSGGTTALVARTADGTIAGGAVGEFFPLSRVMLLSYLAVPAAGRGMGTGGLLLKAATDAWVAEFSPPLLVMEVEDPRHYGTDPAFGDPVARVRFYERLGARTLPVPYFQPALSPGGKRVPHLLLMVFGGIDAPPGTEQVDGSLVGLFLSEYLEGCEGPVRPDDAQAQRSLAACRRPGGLPLLRVSELPSWDQD
jgi:hypothetical protein